MPVPEATPAGSGQAHRATPQVEEPAISARGVRKTYGEGEVAVHALRGIDLEIQPEEFVVLLGPSGSGKTTLLNLVGGIEPASAGEIEVSGRDVTELDEEGRTRFRRETVGFIFQFFNLIPTLTALENVELVAELGRGADRSAEMLERVGLGDRLNHFPAQLSGGEQQRVAVARALAGGPRILLGDEPTGALDLETGRTVLSLLHELSHELHQTVLLVTHNASIARMADRVLRMRDGSIVADRRNPAPTSAEQLDW
ncbi:MAG: ABC transporter ATP-binding protein [Solirubrobacterales bacterium]|nr:ABC transporter ATP-binding protein [Solirubrobacterales bacterium]